MARKTLEKWIAEAINDPDKDGKLTKFVLVHMIGGTQQQEIHTCKLQGVDVIPKDLAEMFQGKADTQAQDLDGRQLFQLLAYYQTKDPEARFPFVCQRQVDPTHGGLMTEPPDERGQLMQNMRHKEQAYTALSGMIGQVYQRQAVMDSHSLRIIEAQANQINNLTAENFQNFGMIKELIFKLADDTHQHRMEEIRGQQSADTRKQVIGMLPALANSLTDREVFPIAAEDTALINSLVENLDEEQGKQFPAFLQSMGVNPVLLGPLASRITKALTAKREKAATIQKVSKTYRGTPELDIGGGSDE